MMDWLLDMLPGGGLTVAAAAVIASVAALFRAYVAGRSAEKSKQKAKEAESRAKELERIRDAALARPSGSVSDDPNNRDNR